MTKLVFIAAITSPIAKNWISYFVEKGYHVDVISLYAAPTDSVPGARVHHAAGPFAKVYRLASTPQSMGESGSHTNPAARSSAADWIHRLNSRVDLESRWIGLVGPVEARILQPTVQRLVEQISPDLVHGLRIPLECESAASLEGYPFVASVWGNDFTLWAKRYRGHRWMTRRALQRADGLIADCHRDVRLAREFGFDTEKPSLVVPGGGGIRLSQGVSLTLVEQWGQRLGLTPGKALVLNPRGRRSYVKTKEFIQAVPLVLNEFPGTVFACVALDHDRTATDMVARLGVQASVKMLPRVEQEDLFAMFRLADVFVSLSVHDGTPNTLLEGMAFGAFPVVGDLESVREWITDGTNGCICDPEDPRQIAQAITAALRDEPLRRRAARANARIVEQRGDYFPTMERVEAFYADVVKAWRRNGVGRG